ncbi:MAG: hypothetical protein Rubg2KO_30390 [Rubricoccaceae bacterium]
MRSLCLALATLIVAPASAQLSGTYTVGGTAPDYATPRDAADDVMAVGVNGDTIFQIRPGTYDTGIALIGEISGASETSRIRFEAENPANRPTLRRPFATSADNYVVRIGERVKWVTFKNLDFVAAAVSPIGRLIEFQDAAVKPAYITIRGCTFTGHSAAGSDEGALISEDSPVVGLVLDQNTFTQGWAAVHANIRGGTVSGASATGGTYTNNTFDSQSMFGIRSGAGHRIADNTFLDGLTTSGSYTAIELGSGNAEIFRNTITLQKGRKGIRMGSDAGHSPNVTNNLISIKPVNAEYGILIAGEFGIVEHNTVRMEDGPVVTSTWGAKIIMLNNIFVNMGADPVLDLGSVTTPVSTLNRSNHNALHSGGPALVEENGVSYATLADWQTATGFDLDSVVKLPTFVSTANPVNLRLAGASVDDVDLLGEQLFNPFVTDDVDGEERSTYYPKMGADEGIPIRPLDNADAPSGFYAVGGSSPDFATPEDAFAWLLDYGMKGPVTFRIRAGNYTVRESFPNTLRLGPADDAPSTAVLAIRGANPANPPVLVSNAATGTNWVFRFRGLDHVELEDLVFDASSAGDLGHAIVLKEGEDGQGTDELTILTSTFTGAASGIASEDRALIWSDDDGHDGLTITGNTFTNGWAGVYLPGTASSDSPDATISNNTFNSQSSGGIYGSLGNVIISGNTFTSDASDVKAIRLGAAEGYRVLGNQIALTSSLGTGLALVGTDADGDGTATVANNMIRADVGIALTQGAIGARLIHNSIYATGTTATPVSVSGAASRIEEMTNTILRSLAGPALALGQSNQLEASDGNVLVTLSHPALVEVGASSYATLAAWQAASGHDANSESFIPGFVNVSAGDLHLTGPFDGDTRLIGLPGTGILADVDGAPRSVVAPYIGADEGTAFPIGIELAVSAMLEGAATSATPDGTPEPMRTDLAAGSLIPLSQPYDNASFDGTPLGYDGPETVTSMSSNAVDWVLVELRETSSGPAVARRAALLGADGAVRQPDGSTTLSFSTLLPNDYHVVLRHRNHLAMMSTSQALSSTSVTVDLRLASSLFSGASAGVEIEPGVLALAAADGSFDGLVTAPDFNVYSSASASGATGYRVEDYTMDGLVTAPDFNLYNANASAGAATQVPEN